MSVGPFFQKGEGVLAITYDVFLRELRERSGGAAISPRVFQDAMSLSQSDFAELAHVHRVTVSRSPDNAHVQDFMRESLRVLSSAAQINHDFGQVAFWFRNEPLPPFGHKTPAQLVSEGRTEDVIAYVDSLNAGAAG